MPLGKQRKVNTDKKKGSKKNQSRKSSKKGTRKGSKLKSYYNLVKNI